MVITPENTPDRFGGIFDSLKKNRGVADYGVVHRDYIFMFKGTSLITVVPVPVQFRGCKPKGASS